MQNSSFTPYTELETFGEKFFPQYTVNYFAHARVFRHGEYYLLASNPTWGEEHLIQQNRPPAGLLNFDELQEKQITLASENYDEMVGWNSGAYQYCRERFNIKNLLLIMVKKNNYVDQYMIDLHDNSHGNHAIELYLNQSPQLEKFFQAFKYQFRDAINNAAKNPVVVDKKYIIQREINRLRGVDSNHTNILYWQDQYAILSPQEYACLKLLAKGARIKEIAKRQKISGRTVETYLMRIKHKLNVVTTSDLINCYWENHAITF